MFFLVSCSSLNKVEEPLIGVKAGDEVEVVTYEGVTLQFTISKIEGTTLFAEDVLIAGEGSTVKSIDIKDIDSMAVKEFSGTRTVLLAASTLAVIGLLGGYVIFF